MQPHAQRHVNGDPQTLARIATSLHTMQQYIMPRDTARNLSLSPLYPLFPIDKRRPRCRGSGVAIFKIVSSPADWETSGETSNRHNHACLPFVVEACTSVSLPAAERSLALCLRYTYVIPIANVSVYVRVCVYMC